MTALLNALIALAPSIEAAITGSDKSCHLQLALYELAKLLDIAVYVNLG